VPPDDGPGYARNIERVTKYTKNIQHFIYQLTYTKLKNLEILNHSKIGKTSSTCFGLQGNHLQGAKVST